MNKITRANMRNKSVKILCCIGVICATLASVSSGMEFSWADECQLVKKLAELAQEAPKKPMTQAKLCKEVDGKFRDLAEKMMLICERGDPSELSRVYDMLRPEVKEMRKLKFFRTNRPLFEGYAESYPTLVDSMQKWRGTIDECLSKMPDWPCGVCTYLNPGKLKACNMCRTVPGAASSRFTGKGCDFYWAAYEEMVEKIATQSPPPTDTGDCDCKEEAEEPAKCTYANPTTANRCGMTLCNGEKPSGPQTCPVATTQNDIKSKVSLPAKKTETADWVCRDCTYRNKPDISNCQICGGTEKITGQEKMFDDDELDALIKKLQPLLKDTKYEFMDLSRQPMKKLKELCKIFFPDQPWNWNEDEKLCRK